MKKVLVILLTVAVMLGISINGSYYNTNYVYSGYSRFYAIALPIAFMILEIILWIHKSKKWYFWLLKAMLVFYSITITLGAQFFSTSELESNTGKAINNSTITADEIQDYRSEIKVLNEQINQYIAQQKIFGTEKNKADKLRAENRRDLLQSKLDNAREELKSDAAIINKTMTSYDWYSSVSGFKPESIRMFFQLFASVLLALIAPIALKMLFTMVDKKDIKKTVKKIDKVSKPKKKSNIPKNDKKTILKMILYNYPSRGFMTPENASKYFKDFNAQDDTVKAYSIKDCKTVYDELIDKNLYSKSRKEIEEAML